MALEKNIFCCYCGRIIYYPLKKTVEHLIPLSKGGSNLPNNKQNCCDICNGFRSNKSLDAFKNDILQFLNHKKDCTFNHKLLKLGYNIQDLETMIENIDYWEHYIKTSNGRLLRKKVNIKK